jgi:zinc protease
MSAFREKTIPRARRALFCRALPAVTLVAGCVARHPPPSGSAEAVSYPLAQSRVAGGLRVVVETSPDSGNAAVALAVRAGSADDPKRDAGLAYLVEHLVFDSKVDGAPLSQRLDLLGASRWNGLTSWDETKYYAVVPAQNLSSVLRLFAGMLADPLRSIDESTFEHERQTLLARAHLRTETGMPGQALRVLSADVFSDADPYGHPVTGTHESLIGLTLEDARSFVHDHYLADRSTLVVTSALGLEDAKKAVDEVWSATVDAGSSDASAANPLEAGAPTTLADQPPTAAAPPDTTRPDLENPKATLSTMAMPVSVPTLWIGWPLPAAYRSQGEIAPLLSRMIGAVFSEKPSSLDHDVVDVDAGIVPGASASLLFVRASLKTGKDPRAIEDSIVREILHGLTDTTRTVSGFEEHKRTLATSLLGAEEDMATRALNLALSTDLTDQPNYIRSLPTRTVQLSADAVVDYLRKYLDRERSHAVLVEPLPADSAEPESNATASTSTTVVEPAPVDEATARGWMQRPGLGSAFRGKLKNGMEVVVVPRPRAPFHTAVLAYHGGSADADVRGVDVAALWSLRRFALHDSWGRTLQSRIEPDITMEIVHASGSDASVTLEQLRAMSDAPVTWPPPQFPSRLSAYQKEEQARTSVLARRLKTALYGSSWRIATRDDLLRITPSDVQSFLGMIRRPENTTLVVVGDVNPNAVMAAADEKFGAQSGAESSRPLPTAQPALDQAQVAAGGHILVEHQADLANVEWRWQCILPAATPESVAAGGIVAQTLSDALNREMGEREGASSYEVRHDIEILRGGTAVLSLRADVEYGYLKPLFGTLRTFVDSPANSFLDKNRVARARENVARRFNSWFENTQSIALKVACGWNLGWPSELWETYPDRLFLVDEAQIASSGEHCRSNWVMGLLGDEQRIRSELAGWSP